MTDQERVVTGGGLIDQVRAVLGGVADDDSLVERIGRFVEAIEGCRLEGVRLDHHWVRPADDALPMTELDAALATRDISSAVQLDARGWAMAFDLWQRPTDHAVMVVSSEHAPRAASIRALYHLALVVRSTRGTRISTPLIDLSPEVTSLVAEPSDETGTLRIVHDMNANLRRALTAGEGMNGIARVLNHVVHLPVAIVDVNAVLAAEPPELCEVGSAMPDHIANVLAERPDDVFRQAAWVCATAATHDGTVTAVCAYDPAHTVDALELAALEFAAGSAALERYRQASAAEASSRVWRGFTNEVLYERDRDRVRAHAEVLGYDLDSPHRVAVITSPTDNEDLESAVARAARHFGLREITGSDGSDIVLLVTHELDWSAFTDHLSDALHGQPVYVGTSRERPSAFDLGDAIAEARTAARLAPSLSRGVVHFENLGLLQLLIGSTSMVELDEYVNSWLGPVVEYDADRGTELVRTLATYLETGGSVDQTAQALFIHRSTLKYRLSRVSDLIGRPLSDPDVRFSLQLAYRIRVALRAVRIP